MTICLTQSRWLQVLLLWGRDPDTNQSVIPEDVVKETAKGQTISVPSSEYPEYSPFVYGLGQQSYTYQGRQVRFDRDKHTSSQLTSSTDSGS